MNKQVGDITAEEMLAELDALPASKSTAIAQDDARTIKEWAVFWGMHRQRASVEVGKGVDAGLMEQVDRKRQHITGKTCTYPCYRWIKKK